MIEVVYNPVPRSVQVWTYAGSQGWQPRGGSIPVTFVNGDQFGAQATASGNVEVFRNGILLGTRSVTSWPFYSGGGYIGIFPIATSNTLIDNFGGGTRDSVPIATNTSAPITNTGFLSPSANAAQTSSAGDNNGYQTNPASAYANDSSVATDTNSGTNTNTSCTNTGKDKHLYYNFNFSLPSTAVVQGIQVRLDARADATSGSPRICVQISRDGGVTWTSVKSTATLVTTEATYTLGNSSDTWGASWTPDHFSNANFRLRIMDVASNTSRDFFLDYLAINVTYRP
jgi:hypothetical protein